ncbi:MAG TPA: carbohydrate ABC transporter permease [Ktedonosporobacter sp.]|nr:carbohydrate ABC transporter permease [Ktedonosporobacter sp.]
MQLDTSFESPVDEQAASELPLWQRRQHPFTRWSLQVFMLILAVIMIFPFVYIVSLSFSSIQDVARGGLNFIPAHPTLEGYQWLWGGGVIIPAFIISVVVTLSSTAISLLLTTMMAYGLSRRQLPGGKFLLWIVLLTLLISPGIIPNYLLVQQLGLLNTLWALILPGAVTGFHIIVMRQFFMNIPQELIDCARIDGANEWQILWRIVLPLSKAVVAVIALFVAVNQWNSFFNAIVYLSDPTLYPLSMVVRTLVLQGEMPADYQVSASPPTMALQMAAVVVTTIPILMVYPFLQRHFTKGVLTGSIKG